MSVRLTAVIALPISERRVAYDFYTSALGLAAVGEPESDGVPEPLELVVNDGLHLVLVPAGGFAWTLGDRQAAPPGAIGCLLGLTVANRSAVDALLGRAVAAGAEIVTPTAEQPWGYAGTFADPDGHLWQVTAKTGES